MTKKLYAWEENGKWCLSRFNRQIGKPRNVYETKQEVTDEAARRQTEIEWIQ